MKTDQLLKSDGSLWSIGYSGYLADYGYDNHNLLVGIKFSLGEEFENIHGLLDTGSEWVVFSKEFIDDYDIEIDDDTNLQKTMFTRFGRIEGYLNRLLLILIAENGDSLPMEATCFISQDWPGPPVIGWKGCLERIKFAVDPSIEKFYFGPY